MKVIPFTVPVADGGTVVIQEDILPYFYNYLHRHKEAQVTLIIKGEGTLIAGNYTQPVKAGDVYVIGANQPHMFRSDAKYFENVREKNIHAIHIFFDHEQGLQGLFSLPEMENVRKFLLQTRLSIQLPGIYEEKVGADILRITRLSGAERLLAFVNMLVYFSKHVKEWKSMSTGFSRHIYSESEGMRMNDIYQYTLEHYAENITLEKIASVAHLTTYAFCKYFKKHTRKTYLGFLHEIRINAACKKMIKGDFDSIASVAYATGYNNPITFNRVFRKVTGMSPSTYARQYRYDEVNAHSDGL
ncbi:AraC family transcriptional regulator [Chitinophaga nivalis]|uniref:AraC family transcriptional regulator n=1 Tax=Chitinophaga nivalis TaxID=2991709 RepID=A0ABT3IHP1_9BACT|nr:AraC family transcriptional regulator [Chitinophaga nivalis]MCW3466837.1 AraC family transcriptional regulator [Chitinophaga nivalis]MCW3483472.1 AraC family transcriptional regulator [Chitinophaga nivalis]